MAYLVTYSIYSLLYLFGYYETIFSKDYFPIRDSFTYHYNSFHLFANNILHYGRPPEWFPAWGGWPAGIGLPALFYFLPYKLIGYAGAIIKIDTLLLYKLSLALGNAMVATMWHSALVSFGFSRWASFISSLCFLFGGVGLTVFHQDQVLASVFWYPFVILAISRYLKGQISIVATLIFIGMLMSSHRPVIHLYTLLCCLVLGLIYYRGQFIDHLIRMIKSPKAIVWGAIALMPFFYLMSEVSDYLSPIRVNDILTATSYNDYLVLNEEQKSSAPSSYFMNYVWPGYLATGSVTPGSGQDDSMNLFITRAGLVLAIVGAVICWKKSWALAPLVLFLGWATLGIYGGLPKILYSINLPGISSFRQWYHFSSLLNLALCLYVVYGAEWLLARNWIRIKKGILALVVSLLIIGEGMWFGQKYFEWFGPSFTTFSHPYLPKNKLSNFHADMDYMNFFATRDAAQFLEKCPEWHQPAAIGLHTQQLKLTPSTKCPILPDDVSYLPVRYQPNGIWLEINTAQPITVVLPMSAALTDKVLINDMKSDFKDFHGMSSISLTSGKTILVATIDTFWQRLSISFLLVAMFWGIYKVISTADRKRQE